MELKYITIRNKQYPACMSLRVATRVEEQLGSLDALFEAATVQDALKTNIWFIAQCLQAGKLYAELEGIKTEQPPEEDTLFDLLGIADATRAVSAIIDASQQVTVELQPDEKNVAATQDA